MDWLLNHTNHCGFLGTTIGTEPFTDLDFADDVALLTEMLSFLILALEIVYHESKLLGLQINWSKTRIKVLMLLSLLAQCQWLETTLKSSSLT